MASTQPSFVVNLTYRQESVNGIHVSVLKSAIQKFIRRGEIDLGLVVIGYLSAFDDSTSQGKRIRTNVTNRFVACMSEEVSINEWNLPDLMRTLYNKWTSKRANVAEATIIWVEMFRLLVLSRKCRVVSDYKTRFNLPPYKIKIEKLEPMWRQLLLQHRINVRPSPKDVPHAKRDLVQLMKKKEDEAFDDLRYILTYGNNKDIDHIFDAIIEAIPLIKKQVQALAFFWKKMTHAEKPIYLYHALLLALKFDEFDTTEHLNLLTSPGELTLEFIIAKTVEHGEKDFPDYVYDKHTTKNADAKTSLDFATEGALVKDEEMKFLNPLYRSMYIDFKKIQTGVHL